MTDVQRLLASAVTILLIDWPSRDVPDTLARHGFNVVSQTMTRPMQSTPTRSRATRSAWNTSGDYRSAPTSCTHRPVDELSEVVETAKTVGAKAVWIQSGRDRGGVKNPHGVWLAPDDSRRARDIVEVAGLEYVEAPYIGDAVRTLE